MTPFDLRRYQPGDVLYLWWLANPAAPRLIGELRMARSLKGVSLVYAPAWLASGFALSEDLPLMPGEFFPHDKESAAGAVDDARPDRWGERVIRMLDKPPRLAVLDFLFFAGDERFGALGVSVSASDYLARVTGPLPRLADAQEVHKLVAQILAGEPVAPDRRRLIAPGATLGGARPKALLELDGHPWVIKFNEPGEAVDMPLVEHAAMTLRRTRAYTPRPRDPCRCSGATPWPCAASTAWGGCAATHFRPTWRSRPRARRRATPSWPSGCAGAALRQAGTTCSRCTSCFAAWSSTSSWTTPTTTRRTTRC